MAELQYRKYDNSQLRVNTWTNFTCEGGINSAQPSSSIFHQSNNTSYSDS